MQELSAGQVTTMARNEKVIEKLSGQPATYNLKRCLTVPWRNEKVIERLSGQPATCDLQKMPHCAVGKGHACLPVCPGSPVCWTRAPAGWQGSLQDAFPKLCFFQQWSGKLLCRHVPALDR